MANPSRTPAGAARDTRDAERRAHQAIQVARADVAALKAAPALTATKLATTGAPVAINGSLPPTAGQVLIAVDETTAEWADIPALP